MSITKTYYMRNCILPFIGCLLLILSFTACKEDEADPCAGTQLPVLETCAAVAPTGHLEYIDSSGAYLFTTSGGGRIVIDSHFIITVRHNDYTNMKIEFWGNVNGGEPFQAAYHENLNGKHIKDRIHPTRRTLVFPDGAKLTMITGGADKRLNTLAIYDGGESHIFNVPCNKLEHSSASNACVAKLLDDAEADGEAGSFEFDGNTAWYFNSYTEDVAGEKVENRYNLGELDSTNHNWVRDWYDDPRLAHT